MALINCLECGNKISDSAKICPHCGVPKKKIKCRDCNAQYLFEMNECPQCGCPTSYNYSEKREKNYKIIAIIILLLCVVTCIGLIIIAKWAYGSNAESEQENKLETEQKLEDSVYEDGTDVEEVKRVFEAVMTDLQTGEFDEVQVYLSKRYDFLDNVPYEINSADVLKSLFEKYSYEIKEVSVENNNAIMLVKMTVPDYMQILDASISGFSLSDSNSMERAVEKQINSSDLKYVTNDASFSFICENNEWKLFVDDSFMSSIFYGMSSKLTFDTITNNEKKIQEKKSYIDNYMVLVDFLVAECEGYNGKVPGLRNIVIKNNGTKNVTSVTLALDFVNEKGEIIASKEMVVIANSDIDLKPNYSWKMEDGTFYEIENLNSNVDINRVNVYICDITMEEINYDQIDVLSSYEQYIQDNIQITDYSVKYYSSYDGEQPGIGKVELKNSGDKNIDSLTITVYFQNEMGENIAEDSFTIIGGWSGGDTLKANYSWKMSADRFYSFDNLSSEVDLSRHNVKITDIEFE